MAIRLPLLPLALAFSLLTPMTAIGKPPDLPVQKSIICHSPKELIDVDPRADRLGNVTDIGAAIICQGRNPFDPVDEAYTSTNLQFDRYQARLASLFLYYEGVADGDGACSLLECVRFGLMCESRICMSLWQLAGTQGR